MSNQQFEDLLEFFLQIFNQKRLLYLQRKLEHTGILISESEGQNDDFILESEEKESEIQNDAKQNQKILPKKTPIPSQKIVLPNYILTKWLPPFLWCILVTLTSSLEYF